MPHSNISVFVPHVGCPHTCAFCNQRTITGTEKIPRGEDVRRICTKALSDIKSPQDTEIAFFGGSFTAIPRKYMLELLTAASEFVSDGKFAGIRLSTRPDYIDEEVLGILKSYGVTSIELGAQSMCDDVLSANERGHTSEDVENASRLIKEYGFELGLQMMIGLYKSSPEKERESFEKICGLCPDTLRIYPVVILEDTKLGELYKCGGYETFNFDTAVELCSEFLTSAENRGIRVIKLGLHASEFVEEKMLGGYYHPAFRELCEGKIYRNTIEKALAFGGNLKVRSAVLSVPARSLSKALGQKKCNIKYFADKEISLKIVPDKEQFQSVKVLEINGTAVR